MGRNSLDGRPDDRRGKVQGSFQGVDVGRNPAGAEASGVVGGLGGAGQRMPQATVAGIQIARK